MFAATVTKQGDIQTRHTISVYTDTLFEAELYVQAFFVEAYGTPNVSLKYIDGLEYALYIDGEAEAYLQIRMIE
jgi:hypothetical protein